MNEVIRAGEEMRRLRAEMIKVFAGFGWTQERIARLTDMSRPPVSKQMAKYRDGELRPPMEVSLDQRDAPWLEGRLWGLAEGISEILDETAHCTRSVNALTRGRKRFTPHTSTSRGVSSRRIRGCTGRNCPAVSRPRTTRSVAVSTYP